jgi:hypothetical protein
MRMLPHRRHAYDGISVVIRDILKGTLRYNGEASIMRKPWPTGGFCTMREKKINLLLLTWYILGHAL